MAPIILDTTPDLDLDGPATMARNNTPPFTTNAPTTDTGSTITTTTQQQQLQQQHKRTLLLAPPALASREDRLSALFATAYPRATTDLHMLDRLAAGLVALPAATYDLVLVLTDPDPVPSPNGGNNNNSNNSSSSSLLGGSSRAAWARLAGALRPGGRLEFESAEEGRDATVAREAVLAGLVPASEREEGGAAAFVKPEYAEEEVVPLRLLGGKGRKKEEEQNGAVQPPPAAAPAAVAGVGFVDFSDDLDLDAEDDDDVIDEDTLLTEEDLRRPIQQPPECQPQPGKKRRACKDCTCGLAARLEAEDRARREKADKDLGSLKLKSEDLNELDFTVQGKTGSCGSCYLGDAFRCSDCPYIGLPAFKPGEEVKILNNTVQL